MDKPKPSPTESVNALTRREWLLRLGGVTALAGVAGMVPEMATALTRLEEGSAAALPPGLYQPSSKHLMHALSAQGAPEIPPGTETDYVQPRPGPYRPQFFSADEFRAVTRLIEILLGNVDAGALAASAEWLDLHLYANAGVREAARRLDPLHRALAVAYYGATLMTELETADLQRMARDGMAALAEHSHRRFGRPFLDLARPEQVDVVREISQLPQESALRRFYDLVHREAIRGYYTTRVGLRELDYKGNAYYAECPGCEKNTYSQSPD
jgi:hypothetical protein